LSRGISRGAAAAGHEPRKRRKILNILIKKTESAAFFTKPAFVETLHIKKKDSVNRRGFNPFPAHPDKIFIGRVKLGHSRKLMWFGDYFYPNQGRHSGGAAPRERE
jgi:hypothetical protein